jgi:hypothetical protein
MYGIVRYSFTIAASFCAAVLAGERPFGQVLKGEAELRKPRVIRVAPNGDLFVADTMFDAVHVLRAKSAAD